MVASPNEILKAIQSKKQRMAWDLEAKEVDPGMAKNVLKVAYNGTDGSLIEEEI